VNGSEGRRKETYLVNHHDGEQIADGREEETVQVVLHLVADGVGEGVEDDLADNQETGCQGNIAQWPAVLQRVENEDKLHDDVDNQADTRDEVQHDEQANGVCWTQRCPALERG